MSQKNISVDEIEKSFDAKPVVKQNSQFDEKNYLNVRLEKNQIRKDIKIRLITIDKDSNSPFKRIHMHTTRVPKEISKNGFKAYVCLNKTHDKYSDELGTKCPFCEMNQEAYKKYVECKEAGDMDNAERYKHISVDNIPSEVGILRVIERGHEEDGPKFWKFNIRKDKKDPEHLIRKIYNDRKEECIEEGIEVENILDIDTGKDLKVTIEAVLDADGKPTNKTTISITAFGSNKPLTNDPELRDKWINDPKTWCDVFVAKPYDYTSIILDGEVPFFDKEKKTWVPMIKTNEQKENEQKADEEVNDAEEKMKSDAKESEIAMKAKEKAKEVVVDEDTNDLPF